MYRLQEIVDRILSSKTTGALLDEMRKELRLVGVDYFCLVRYGQAGEHVDQWVIGQRASQKMARLVPVQRRPIRRSRAHALQGGHRAVLVA